MVALGWTPVVVAVAAIVLPLLCSVLNYVLIKPWLALRRLRAQGIRGYPVRPLIGQLPEFISIEMARAKNPMFAASTHGVEFFFNGTKEFGKIWTWSFGHMPRVVLADPALVRNVFVSKYEEFGKPLLIPKVLTLLGLGLVSSNGKLWSKQRKIINPAFGIQELKLLFHTMVDCTSEHMEHLLKVVKEGNGAPIEMQKEFTELTLNIICTAAFGLRFGQSDKASLEAMHSAFDVYIRAFEATAPFINMWAAFRFLPTPDMMRKWQSEAVIRKSMDSIIQGRIRSMESDRTQGAPVKAAEDVAKERTDLLQLLLDSKAMSLEQLTDESLTFLLAGHETTATLMMWTSLLLAQHRGWQDKAREEVLRIKAASPNNGPGWTPSFEEVGEMKLLYCIIHESLRIFPPVAATARECHTDVRLTDSLVVPAGCEVLLPIEVLHHSEELWGKDVKEFNPGRFANGVASAASQPGSFCPFTLGPRVCIGQNFALIEGKLILAMMLDRFTWTLDKSYIHHPMAMVTVKPKFGMPLVLTARDA